MQPYGCLLSDVMEDVFKALADPTRRRLLDALNAHDGQSLRELCAGLAVTRQAVTKHLAVLGDRLTGHRQAGAQLAQALPVTGVQRIQQPPSRRVG